LPSWICFLCADLELRRNRGRTTPLISRHGWDVLKNDNRAIFHGSRTLPNEQPITSTESRRADSRGLRGLNFDPVTFPLLAGAVSTPPFLFRQAPPSGISRAIA